MAVYKDSKTNTWRAVYRYTDWMGKKKQTQKRGFLILNASEEYLVTGKSISDILKEVQ